MRRLRYLLPCLVAELVILTLVLPARGTLATFNAVDANSGNSLSAARIFSGTRSMSSRTLQDASNGTANDNSDPFSYSGDSNTDQTNANVASGSGAYFELTMNSPLPAALSVSSVQLNFRLNSQGGPGSGNGCFYFDVRSGGSVIGTHGSYASSVGCSSGNTYATFNTSLPEVTTTDIANGLVIRAYVWETGGKKANVDLATVTGSTAYGTFTLYEKTATDTSSGSVTTTWSLTSADAVTYQSGSNFPTAAATTKYLQFAFDPAVPTGATITAATFTFVYRPSANDNSPGFCYYFDAFQNATLLASHGSSSSAVSCNTSGTNMVTDAISVPEVNTAAKADALVIKTYMWGAACGPGCPKGVIDQAQLSVTYSLT